LTTLADGKACLPLTLPTRELTKITLSLLFASFAVLAPVASAQRCAVEPADLTFNLINNGGPYPRIGDTQKTLDSSVAVFSIDDNGAPISNPSSSGQQSPAAKDPGENSKIQPTIEKLPGSRPADFNRDIYYRNKLEFSLDVGWLPLNIPFPFDVFEGDPYDLYPLRYTLVPVVASLRWQIDDVGGPWMLRGNWDVTFSGSFTAIPKGAETRYFSYDMGLRRNFVRRNWKAVPYVDLRAGLGLIDAKGPLGVYYAQGQNFTFTINMGAGARYNFNPRYAISAGLNWMHISNNNLSAPQYSNYGINVYGPMFGIDITLGKPSRHSDQ
jgi:lipid A 3-O-deacylase PagL